MSFFRVFLLITIILSICTFVYGQFSYDEFNALLQKQVIGDKINYQSLIGDKELLIEFTTRLGEQSPDSHPEMFISKNEQLAYWIIVYIPEKLNDQLDEST